MKRCRERVSELVNGALSRSVAYGYDSLWRLTSETITGAGPAEVISYDLSPAYGDSAGYDRVGNRRWRHSQVAAVDGTPLLGTTTMSFDERDRSGSGSGWDANGSYTANGAHQYDFENRLVSWNSGAVTLEYDLDGNRVSKTAGSETTQYLVDELNPTGYAQVIEELDGTGVLQKRYVYGLDLISQTRLTGSEPETHYFHYDAHGNTRFLTDANGDVTDTYDYDAFGILIGMTGPTDNEYLYAGEQFDSDLGLCYLRARYYDANAGRFITMDTFEGSQNDPLSLHKYLYCEGNPVNSTDPSGNEVEPDLGRGQQVHELFYVHCIAWHGIPKFFDAEIGQVFPNIRSRLKPDVLDVTGGRRRFFELKPISYRDWPPGFAAAVAQVGSYVDAMKSVPVKPGDASVEFAGRTPIGVIFDPVEQKKKEVVIEPSETTPGLIYYWLRNPPSDFDWEPFLIPIAIPAAQRAAEAYGGGAAAAATRAVAGRTLIQSRAVMAAVRAIGPSISAQMTVTRF